MAKLRLTGDTSGYIEIQAPDAAGSNTLVLPTGNGSANQFLRNGSTAGTLQYSSMIEDGSNNVGIGESSPNAKLDVYSGAGVSAWIRKASNPASIGFAADTTPTTLLEGLAGGGLVFYNVTGTIASPSYTERLRIQSNGGISFNGDSAAANALDDYEEGTFTVEMQYLSGGAWYGVTFSNTPQTTGYYVKVGNVVTCYYYSTDFQVSGGVSASARFGGLPFACAGLTEGYCAGTVTHVSCFEQANQSIYIGPNATAVVPVQLTSTSTNTWNSTSNVYIMWAVTYRTA